MDPKSAPGPTPNPPVEPSTSERDQAQLNDKEKILQQCAEARQATRDREWKKAQEQQQLASRVHAQMCAQWAQPPIHRAFQGPHPAQYFSHPGQSVPFPAERFAHPRAIRPPPHFLIGGRSQSSFDIYPPPPPDLMARSYSDPANVPESGFGNYPPGPGFDPQSGFNGLSQHGFHDVPQPSGFNGIPQSGFHHGPLPGFPSGPRPQQADHPVHHRKRPPHQQAPEPARMHKSFSAPAPTDPALSSGPESTTARTPTASEQTAAVNSAPSTGLSDPALWTSAASSTAHKPNGRFYAGATQENRSVPPAGTDVQPHSSKAASGSPIVFANEEELLNWNLLKVVQEPVPIFTMANGRSLILPNAWLNPKEWVPNSQPVPCLNRWMDYFNRFINSTTSAPPHPDAFNWEGEFRPWGNGRTFRDTYQRAWFAEAGMNPDTKWPLERPRQAVAQEVGSQQEQPVPEIQSDKASSSTEQNAYQILPADMEQDIATLLGWSASG